MVLLSSEEERRRLLVMKTQLLFKMNVIEGNKIREYDFPVNGGYAFVTYD